MAEISGSPDFEQRPTPSRESELLGAIKEIEVPFMEALKRDYGEERGWRMCAPASIALSRILSARTGVPIGRDIPGEHVELTVGIFDPKTAPDRLSRIEEQTYIRYFTGDGNVYYIDPIYGLLMQTRQQLSEAIQVEKYPVTEVDQALIREHHLYPFDPNHDGLDTSEAFAPHGTSAEERKSYIAEVIPALNDERATMSEFVADSGRVMITDWQKTEAIIKEFAPSWKPERLVRMERFIAAIQAMNRGKQYPTTLLRFAKRGAGPNPDVNNFKKVLRG
ncbi:MAG: hypothetical protein HYW62_01730 [Candidatus Levybacteria bacterium]|nr:hypothetical protein [Candidatus Levybacteria bacterium]